MNDEKTHYLFEVSFKYHGANNFVSDYRTIFSPNDKIVTLMKMNTPERELRPEDHLDINYSSTSDPSVRYTFIERCAPKKKFSLKVDTSVEAYDEMDAIDILRELMNNNECSVVVHEVRD